MKILSEGWKELPSFVYSVLQLIYRNQATFPLFGGHFIHILLLKPFVCYKWRRRKIHLYSNRLLVYSFPHVICYNIVCWLVLALQHHYSYLAIFWLLPICDISECWLVFWSCSLHHQYSYEAAAEINQKAIGQAGWDISSIHLLYVSFFIIYSVYIGILVFVV